MKIAHLCLSCFFIDGRAYQENALIRQRVRDGHDMLVIASTETHASDGRHIYIKPGDYIGKEGARVIRLPYLRGLPLKLAAKLRIHSGVYQLLADFEPERILFHGCSGRKVMTAARYARTHEKVKLYVDSHADWNNSAHNFVSREFLHWRYYKPILHRALPNIEKILCISTETMDFAHEFYCVPQERLEFYPLGGHPLADDEYTAQRDKVRQEYGLKDGNILFAQGGRLTRRKKLIESLKAFQQTEDDRFRLFIFGVFDDNIRSEAENLIEQDNRVQFLGWKSVEELTALLCAADIYLQPGTQSVTMQNSMCGRCAVILDDVPAHVPYMRGNGWLINEKQPLEDILAQVGKSNLEAMQAISYEIACDLLDYKKLAQRILE